MNQTWRIFEFRTNNDKRRRVYFIIEKTDKIIWVDIKYLPKEVFLCASHDGEPAMKFDVGEKRKKERWFLTADWLINKWGGDQRYVDKIKEIVELINKDCEEKIDQVVTNA